MSDEYYRQQAARRARIWWILGGLALTLICVYLGFSALFRDSCTQSFDRDPRTVVVSYLGAVNQGNSDVAIECWNKDAYYDLGSGCSEICLSRFYGTDYQVQDISLSVSPTSGTGASQINAVVQITCEGTAESHLGEIMLDSSAANLPWRHWKIVQSDFGGTNAEPWCR